MYALLLCNYLHVLFLFAVLSGQTFLCPTMTRERAGKEEAEEEEEAEREGYIVKISLLCISLVTHVSVCIAGPLISEPCFPCLKDMLHMFPSPFPPMSPLFSLHIMICMERMHGSKVYHSPPVTGMQQGTPLPWDQCETLALRRHTLLAITSCAKYLTSYTS